MIEKIKELASKLEDKTIAYRKDLHHFPEPRWREFRTSSIAMKKMPLPWEVMPYLKNI